MQNDPCEARGDFLKCYGKNQVVCVCLLQTIYKQMEPHSLEKSQQEIY